MFDAVAVWAAVQGKKIVVFAREHLCGQAPLFEIVETNGRLRGKPRSMESREQEPGQQCNNCNNDQQFDECESWSFFHFPKRCTARHSFFTTGGNELHYIFATLPAGLGFP